MLVMIERMTYPNSLDIAIAIINKLLTQDCELTRIVAEVSVHLCVTVVDLECARPLRPWVVWGAGGRWALEKLKVDNRCSAMTDRSTDTIVTSITTADDDDLLALGRDKIAILQVGI